MKNVRMLCLVMTLVAAACGGGEAGCAAIVDDGMVLFQDVIDEMEGLSLNELDDPFDSPVWDARAEDLERRTEAEGCTDEEMTELFADKLPVLEAGDNNPGGQFLVSLFNQAADSGTFNFSG